VGDHLAVDVHHQRGHRLVGMVLALRPEGLEERVVVQRGARWSSPAGLAVPPVRLSLDTPAEIFRNLLTGTENPS